MSKDNSFNVKVLKEHFEKTLAIRKETEGKDLVLFLGNTGSGKSTLLNYLRGERFVKQEDGLETYAIPLSGKESNAPMGDGYESKTIFPQVYTTAEQSNLRYCDLPGFFDTRGKEASVIATVNTEVAIKSAKSINSIFVTIPISAFQGEQHGEVKKIAQTLFSLLYDGNATALHPVYFVFTKRDGKNVSKEGVLRSIKRFSDKLNSPSVMSRIMSGFMGGSDNKNPISEMLKLIESNPDRIIIPDIFDDGTSKKEITALLANENRALISKDVFNFKDFDEHRDDFNDWVKSVVQENKVFLEERSDLLTSIAEDRKTKQMYEANIATYQATIDKLTSQAEDRKTTVNSAIKQDIKKNENLIVIEEKRVQRLESDLEDMQDSLDDLSSEKEEEVRSWDLPKPASSAWEGLKEFCGANKSASYPDAPVSRIKVSPEKARVDLMLTRDDGCHVEYNPKTLKEKYGKVTVVVMVNKNNLPGNVSKRACLEKKIESKEGSLEQSRKEIKRLENLNTKLRKGLNESAQDDNSESTKDHFDMAKRIGELREKAHSLDIAITRDEKKVKALEAALEKEASLFSSLETMNACFDLGSNTLEEFIETYQAYLAATKPSSDSSEEASPEEASEPPSKQAVEPYSGNGRSSMFGGQAQKEEGSSKPSPKASQAPRKAA